MIGRGLVASVVSVVLGLAIGLPARDEIRDLQWHLDYLHIDQAQTVSKGKGVIVGVVDTGVDAGHPDLAGSVLAGIDLSYRPSSDGHTDESGHGTAMAGLIAAHGRATGIAPEAQILPVRLSIGNTFGEPAPGIDWAVDHGATVVCLAFGTDDTPALKASVARAVAHDVVVVASIGNTTDPGAEKYGPYPAKYEGVVAAAGTDRNGNHATVSVTGSQAILAAPAADIVSTASRLVSKTGYQQASGTSDSTAIIAGVAALVRSKYPNLSASEVIHRMTATADDKGPPGRDDTFGYGIVDPVKALTADVPPLATSAAPTNTTDAAPMTPDPPGGNNTLLIAGGVALAAILLAGLVLALRRRRG